jgi:hypothetical protein
MRYVWRLSPLYFWSMVMQYSTSLFPSLLGRTVLPLQNGMYPSHTSPHFISAQKSVLKLLRNPFPQFLQLLRHDTLPRYSSSFVLCLATSARNTKDRF